MAIYKGNIKIADDLPSISSTTSGKYLTNDGTDTSWGTVTVPTKISDLTDDTATNPIDKADTLTNLTATVTELNYTDGVTSNIQTQLDSKQATLVSGTNIKTINNTSLLGSGNITVVTDVSTKQNILTQTSQTTTANISLVDTCNIYTIAPTSATTFTFSGATSGLTYTFELKITMNTVYALTFPSSVLWLDDTAPDLSTTGIYYLVFRTDDGGTTWLGNSQGRWSI